MPNEPNFTATINLHWRIRKGNLWERWNDDSIWNGDKKGSKKILQCTFQRFFNVRLYLTWLNNSAKNLKGLITPPHHTKIKICTVIFKRLTFVNKFPLHFIYFNWFIMPNWHRRIPILGPICKNSMVNGWCVLIFGCCNSLNTVFLLVLKYTLKFLKLRCHTICVLLFWSPSRFFVVFL